MPNWIGPWEIIIVVVIALVVFGPRRLPELGSSLGKAITGFRKGLKESEEEIRRAVASDDGPAQITEVKTTEVKVEEKV